MRNMKTVTVKRNQTLYDIALEQYGTCEAVGEILSLNPRLTNDPAALCAKGIDSMRETAFYIDIAVKPGTHLTVDENSTLIRKSTLREITTDITTYRYGTNDQ